MIKDIKISDVNHSSHVKIEFMLDLKAILDHLISGGRVGDEFAQCLGNELLDYVREKIKIDDIDGLKILLAEKKENKSC